MVINRKAEYKFWERKVKELVNESKKKVNEEFGRKQLKVQNEEIILERSE